jgi:hypothetical protein
MVESQIEHQWITAIPKEKNDLLNINRPAILPNGQTAYYTLPVYAKESLLL